MTNFEEKEEKTEEKAAPNLNSFQEAFGLPAQQILTLTPGDYIYIKKLNLLIVAEKG